MLAQEERVFILSRCVLATDGKSPKMSPERQIALLGIWNPQKKSSGRSFSHLLIFLSAIPLASPPFPAAGPRPNSHWCPAVFNIKGILATWKRLEKASEHCSFASWPSCSYLNRTKPWQPPKYQNIQRSRHVSANFDTMTHYLCYSPISAIFRISFGSNDMILSTQQPSGCASLAEAKALEATVSACSSGGVRFKTWRDLWCRGEEWGKDGQVEGWWRMMKDGGSWTHRKHWDWPLGAAWKFSADEDRRCCHWNLKAYYKLRSQMFFCSQKQPDIDALGCRLLRPLTNVQYSWSIYCNISSPNKHVQRHLELQEERDTDLETKSKPSNEHSIVHHCTMLYLAQ